MQRIFLIGMLVMALSGCSLAVIRPAPEPTADTDRARLRGVGDPVMAMVVDQSLCFHITDPKRHSGMLLSGEFFLTNSGYKKRSIGMPAMQSAEKNWGEMYITANSYMRIGTYHDDGDIGLPNNGVAHAPSCNVAVYFTPAKDRDYEAVARYNGGNCTLLLFDITDGKRTPVTNFDASCANGTHPRATHPRDTQPSRSYH